MITRRVILYGFSLGATALAVSRVDPINKGRGNLAVKGFDVVSYFTTGAAVKGSPQYSFDWNGATWHFAGAAHRDQFASAPDKYAPQFGGYCAWAVGHGYTADIDPEALSIVDGKLYLNYSKGVQKKWTPEKSRWIGEGNRNWPGLHK
jgi:YHS domain-containing protein